MNEDGASFTLNSFSSSSLVRGPLRLFVFRSAAQGSISTADRSRVWFGAILFFSLAAGVFPVAASAQQEDKRVSTTVIGCLQKGEEADEFAITDANEKHYELVSRTIKLSVHVGHKVRVTGTLIGEESEEQEREEGAGWAGKIYVTSLKMVGETCK
jgi:hypothetical protein